MHNINPTVGCHYFPPGPQLPSQLSGVAAFRPVPSYTEAHRCEKLAQFLRHVPGGESNLPPLGCKSDALSTAPRRHLFIKYDTQNNTYIENRKQSESKSITLGSHDNLLRIGLLLQTVVAIKIYYNCPQVIFYRFTVLCK